MVPNKKNSNLVSLISYVTTYKTLDNFFLDEEKVIGFTALATKTAKLQMITMKTIIYIRNTGLEIIVYSLF